LQVKAERGTPNEERRTRNAERGTPNAERRTRNAKRGTRNAKRGTYKLMPAPQASRITHTYIRKKKALSVRRSALSVNLA